MLPLLFVALFSGLKGYGQIVGGNAYLIGSFVEIAVQGDAGHEGTADWPGHHSRGGFVDVPYGFVANPLMDAWANYDGDFFTSGIPENGFGIEINGSNYSNNAWNSGTSTVFLKQIPTAPGGTVTHTSDGDCITVEWEGKVAGVRINVKYHLKTNDVYYTTEITLKNESGTALTDVYYYRNVDPDNNESIGGTYETTNTIQSQSSPDCIKSLVSATQSAPRGSYLGLGALGSNFRVSHGGFSNRSGSAIWNALGGLHGDEGDVETGDHSISLAYKTNMAVGETVNFKYTVVLSATAVEDALSSLYYISYETALGDVGGSEGDPCNPEVVTVPSCKGSEVTLTINGPSVDDYNWVWSTGDPGQSTTIDITPESGTYTVVGTPTMPCLAGIITKSVMIDLSEGPKVDIIDPGPVCTEFNLDTLEWYDTGGGENTVCIFLTEEPDSATQVEPEFPGPTIYPEDEVWLMCGDTVTGCYDWVKLDLDFIVPGGAGPDSTVNYCGGPGVNIDLGEMINDTLNQNGYFYDFGETGRLNDSLGIFYASNLYGTYVFAYIIEGFGDCLGDTAILTVNIIPSPLAYYKYEINGESSEDGLWCTCIINEIDFFDQSIMEDPGYIVSWEWDFGDLTTSTEVNPSHTYGAAGNYLVKLRVTSDNGCISTHTKRIKIYEAPQFDVVGTNPVCHGDTNGTISVSYENCVDTVFIEIRDELDNLVNTVFADSAYGLGPGTYTINVSDPVGCGSSKEITLTDPPMLEIYYTIGHPPCLGDSGYVLVDSVFGENPNNPISFNWDPNPSGVSGIGADSSFWMVAGDYTVTATDAKGCTVTTGFTLIDPPAFYFTEWGWDTAYCRLYNYQSGNGVVYAAAAGGLPNYVYQWTYLVDGTQSNSTTWGGRNPGDHLIEVTDAGGCVLSKIVTVDSVNPEASFTVTSAQLTPIYYSGTADVEVEFTNTSKYWANPNDPSPDTLFLWDLDRTEDPDWIITHDYFETFDTIYKARGVSYEVEVCLIAFNKNLCSDTACEVILIFEPPELSTVNIFTPNSGNENDVLTFEHHAKGIRDFNCIIVNRWGVKVGEITDIRGFWDGNDRNGDPCTDGVYFYTYTAIADNGTKFAGQGNVTLVR